MESELGRPWTKTTVSQPATDNAYCANCSTTEVAQKPPVQLAGCHDMLRADSRSSAAPPCEVSPGSTPDPPLLGLVGEVRQCRLSSLVTSASRCGFTHSSVDVFFRLRTRRTPSSSLGYARLCRQPPQMLPALARVAPPHRRHRHTGFQSSRRLRWSCFAVSRAALFPPTQNLNTV